MKSLIEDRKESRTQWWYVLMFRTIGTIMFIAVMYEPMRAYFLPDVDNLTLNTKDIGFGGFGFFLALGGKAVGVLANNLGMMFQSAIKKTFNINDHVVEDGNTKNTDVGSE